MRILMLAQFYPPTIGGEERHVQDLSVELAARGHDVAVATLWHTGLPDFEIDRGVRVYRLRGTVQRAAWVFKEPARRHAPPFPDPELTLAVRRIIAAEQPAIVHGHNWMLHSFLPLKVSSRARFVVTLHDYSLVCAKKRLMYHGSQCSGPAPAKCLGCAIGHYGLAKGLPTVVSNWAMSAMEQMLVDMFLPTSQAVAEGSGLVGSRLPFQIIPNFVPDALRIATAASHPYITQLPEEGFLLFVGDLSREKGVHILLRAYAGLESAPPLVLIGRQCLDTPRDIPPNVRILNDWPHEAVMQAWRRSSIGLAPSVWAEPFGIVVIEAMASGCPVIASRTGGISDIVLHEETGVLVPPGDVLALRYALNRLLHDPGLRQRMGRAGQSRVAEFQAHSVVPRVEQVYRQLEQRNLYGQEAMVRSDKGLL
ncbi:MAG TPA: glycosyltransferase family 4 protein [Roseiflexaceae bacterium]|nr:glycosyltransferase family 4 protein [Roseiflexaceae bacterium]